MSNLSRLRQMINKSKMDHNSQLFVMNHSLQTQMWQCFILLLWYAEMYNLEKCRDFISALHFFRSLFCSANFLLHNSGLGEIISKRDRRTSTVCFSNKQKWPHQAADSLFYLLVFCLSGLYCMLDVNEQNGERSHGSIDKLDLGRNGQRRDGDETGSGCTRKKTLMILHSWGFQRQNTAGPSRQNTVCSRERYECRCVPARLSIHQDRCQFSIWWRYSNRSNTTNGSRKSNHE